MLKPINTFEQCRPNRLKKFFQSNISYKCYNELVLNSHCHTVGNLPPEIIRSFSQSNLGENIKKYQGALADVSNYLREYFINLNKTTYFNMKKLPVQERNRLEDNVSRLLTQKTKNLFKQDVYSSIKFVNRGDFGNVYRLSLTDENGNKLMHDKALKVYHFLAEKERGLRAHHGSMAEANIWTWLKFHAGHKFDKTQFNKHYISDIKNGYAMTEFLDNEIKLPTSKLKICDILNLNSWELTTNRPIQGKIYDVGGFFKDFDFIEDKMVRRFYKKLYFRNFDKDLPKVMENLEKQAYNPKYEHRSKIQAALEIFKTKFQKELEERFGNARQN